MTVLSKKVFAVFVRMSTSICIQIRDCFLGRSSTTSLASHLRLQHLCAHFDRHSFSTRRHLFLLQACASTLGFHHRQLQRSVALSDTHPTQVPLRPTRKLDDLFGPRAQRTYLNPKSRPSLVSPPLPFALLQARRRHAASTHPRAQLCSGLPSVHT